MTLGSHQRAVGRSQVYITPREIVAALGLFDLDPCAATPRPWSCALANYTETDDGLSQPWYGRVWLNPPFDRRRVGQWIERLAEHGTGTTLVHARTETEWFRPIWERATALLFLAQRWHFYHPDGQRYSANSGAPLVLAAFGEVDAILLRGSGLAGTYVPLATASMIERAA